MSSERSLNGGGPQDGNFGILEYLSQNNNNFDFIDDDMRFKYFDDDSILEVVNLLRIGLSSSIKHNHTQPVHPSLILEITRILGQRIKHSN